VGTCVGGLLDDRLDGRLRRLVDQFADGRARRIDLLDAREDAVGRSERHSNRASSGERESLLAVEVVWVGSGDIQGRRRDGERQDAKPASQLLWNSLTRLRADH